MREVIFRSGTKIANNITLAGISGSFITILWQIVFFIAKRFADFCFKVKGPCCIQ